MIPREDFGQRARMDAGAQEALGPRVQHTKWTEGWGLSRLRGCQSVALGGKDNCRILLNLLDQPRHHRASSQSQPSFPNWPCETDLGASAHISLLPDITCPTHPMCVGVWVWWWGCCVQKETPQCRQRGVSSCSCPPAFSSSPSPARIVEFIFFPPYLLCGLLSPCHR